MKAIQSDVRSLLEGSKQYVLPLYQRRYSWRTEHWRTLADDLDRLLAEPDRRSHFVGSFVSAPLGVAADQSVTRYRLIDGQQRLTTILLLLTAIRDVATEQGDAALAERTQGKFLTNAYEKGDAARKLLLTAKDQPDLARVLARQPRPADAADPRIEAAHAFFADHLRDRWPDALADVLQTVVGRLSVVNITLEADDDPHLIFESLNAKGERLSPSDLLRNYFLMRLPQADADGHFGRLWQPMQDRLGEDLTPFFRHYLMREADDGNVRKDKVYYRLKERVDDAATTPERVVAELQDIHQFALYYARLTDPAGSREDAATARRVVRLHRLRSTTAYPFLMNVMDAIAAGRLTADAYPATLDLIESFLVRRLTCGVPSNQLRKIFLGLCGEAAAATDTPAFLAAVRAGLSMGSRCPDDNEFRDVIIHGDLYGGTMQGIARYLLNRLELSFEHKEPVDVEAKDIQVEHVMPQTLTDTWRAALSPADPAEADAIHDL